MRVDACSCKACLAGDCWRCDGTVWDGSRPTYCACWSFGHAGYDGEDSESDDFQESWQIGQDRYDSWVYGE